ncbi:hypothetical protein D9M69_668600 [compost metagenome]
MLVSFVERSMLALRALSAVIAFPQLKSFRVLEQLAAFANAFRTAPNNLTFYNAHFIQKPFHTFLECAVSHLHFARRFLNIHNETRFS